MSSALSSINRSIQNPPQRFKVGDNVIVTNPEFVTRVGYPLSFDEAVKFVMDNYKKDILDFLDNTIWGKSSANNIAGWSILDVKCAELDKNEKAIVYAMAKLYLQKMRYGGTQRSIHTEDRPQYLGMQCTITEKRVCKTGTYDPPYSHQSYEGDWDCYSGGLTDCKTHVLLGLDYRMMPLHSSGKWAGLWIESKNVRKRETD